MNTMGRLAHSLRLATRALLPPLTVSFHAPMSACNCFSSAVRAEEEPSTPPTAQLTSPLSGQALWMVWASWEELLSLICM